MRGNVLCSSQINRTYAKLRKNKARLQSLGTAIKKSPICRGAGRNGGLRGTTVEVGNDNSSPVHPTLYKG